MGGLLRKKGPSTAQIVRQTGLSIQTSGSVPISIVYGINKVAPNLIWYGNFAAYAQYTKKSGKGGGGRTVSGYRYSTSLIFGVCEGPVTSISVVWKDQGVYAPWQLGFGVTPGATTQGLFTSVTGAAQALAYRGIACAAAAYYDLGDSTSMGNHEFEVYGRCYKTAVVNSYDADPTAVIYDFLTNSQYGVGFPASAIDLSTLQGPSGGSSMQAYCWAAGIAFSPVLDNRESANSILTRWLRLTNCNAVWSGGKLKFIPYGDATINGTFYGGAANSFVPNVTPVYNLTDDDFVGNSESDPVLIERKDQFDIPNALQFEYSYRWNGYNSVTISIHDQASIEKHGLRTGSSVAAHEICDSKIAQTVAQLIMQREVYVKNTYSFKLSFQYCLLEPMDIVTLTDAGLGLSNTPVRILSIEEDDNGDLSVTAEEFPGSLGVSVAYPTQTTQAQIIDRNVVPAAVNAPIVFEPPASLTNGTAQVWAAVSGGVPTAWKLDETATAGSHTASASLASTTAGTAVQFVVYAQAAERSACQLQIFDGSATQKADYDLSIGTATITTTGVIIATITDQGGSWWKLVLSCVMAATAAPTVTIAIENPAGTASYTGIAGNGIHIWAPEASVGGNLSQLPMPMAVAGAGLTADSTLTPEGVKGTADPNWGGCIVYLSTDNVNFGQIGQINGPARQGFTTASLASAGTSVPVSLVESAGTLAPAAATDAANGITLSIIENELVAYSSATLTGTNTYNLGGLVRGLYGTNVPASHPNGSAFARLDDAIFKYSLDTAYVGKTLYLKFQSFNIYGINLQDLSTCAVYSYVPSGIGAGLGPVATPLAAGTNLDFGLVSQSVSTSDDFGYVSNPSTTIIDLGFVTS